jgi:type IV pilus assembly protein PilN
MIRINLLPFRAARKQENVKRQVIVFLLSLALTVVIVLALGSYTAGVVTNLEKKIDETDQDYRRFQRVADQTKKLKADLEVLKNKFAVITDLQKDQTKSLNLLNMMPDVVIEKRMWVTGMESIARDAPGNTKGAAIISLQGISTDETTAAQFMKNLEKTGKYAEVILISLVKAGEEKMDANFLKFDIRCVEPVPVAPAPPPKPGGPPGAPPAGAPK